MKPFKDDEVIDGRVFACMAAGIMISREGITFDVGLTPMGVAELYRIAPTADDMLELIKRIERHEGVLLDSVFALR